jgi:hypothetical protein
MVGPKLGITLSPSGANLEYQTHTITCIEAGTKLARKCKLPDDYFSQPCP